MHSETITEETTRAAKPVTIKRTNKKTRTVEQRMAAIAAYQKAMNEPGSEQRNVLAEVAAAQSITTQTLRNDLNSPAVTKIISGEEIIINMKSRTVRQAIFFI